MSATRTIRTLNPASHKELISLALVPGSTYSRTPAGYTPGQSSRSNSPQRPLSRKRSSRFAVIFCTRGSGPFGFAPWAEGRT